MLRPVSPYSCSLIPAPNAEDRTSAYQVERQLKDVQHQLHQEKTRMQLKEEAFERDREMWVEAIF